jgi:thioredoxin reductase (NADPH)
MKITGVRIKNLKTGEISEKEFGWLFVYIGIDPMTDTVKDLGITDEIGWIITDQGMQTNVPGIFAVGDVRQKTSAKSRQLSEKVHLQVKVFTNTSQIMLDK